MLAELKELWRFRELLLSMVERELRIRYKNSVLGFFWSLINPLVTVAVMTFVFKYIVRNETPNFGAYVLAAYLPFLFFQLAVMDSAQSIIVALPLVKKIYFPREILPLAGILSNFVHLVLALLVFFVYLFVVYLIDPRVVPFQWTTVYLPLLLIINLALALGLGFIVSALNTFYEDVKYIVNVILYLMFFLCPIMYFSEQVSDSMSKHGTLGSIFFFVYHLNPVATLSTAYRKVLVAPQPVDVGAGRLIPALPLDWPMLGAAALISFSLLYFGYRLFNRLKWKFVERP
jgi:lipopolysaccharide transport system permease protein